MRVDRRFLYLGLFLAALGGVLVAADLAALDGATLVEALRFWPLAIVALGAALALRRTRAALLAGLLAAVLPGVVLGGAIAAGPQLVETCGSRQEPIVVASEQGRLRPGAVVDVETACGSLAVRVASGDAWRLEGSNTSGVAPRIDASDGDLAIGVADDLDGWHALRHGRDTWDLTLPTTPLAELRAVVNAGDGTLQLGGADVARLVLVANAAAVTADAGEASLAELRATVNAGSLGVTLPAGGDLTGTLDVNAGELRICAPPGLGLRVITDGPAADVSVQGQALTGDTWQSPGYASAAHRAELRAEISFGALDIDPIGGCK